MTSYRRIRFTVVASILTCSLLLLAAAGVANALLSNQMVFKGQFGWKVNTVTGENFCSTELECQPGTPNEGSGGFQTPIGVAVSPAGNVYVADGVNNRVEEFSAQGEFVRMFGWEVNEKKDAQAGATKEEKNVCTKLEQCEGGKSGGSAGQFDVPSSIAIDPTTGNLYISDLANWRVEEYSETGEFLLAFGWEVNETKDAQVGATDEEKNICTKLESCKAGVVAPEGSKSHSAFKFSFLAGDILSVAQVGAPAKSVLYEGDEERIQEFSTDGKWINELSLAALGSKVKVTALATQNNEIYVVYGSKGIRVLNSNGGQIREFGTTGTFQGLALDPFGRLAASEAGSSWRGVLFEASTGNQLGEFKAPPYEAGGTRSSLAFNENIAGGDELYAADMNHQTVEMYAPVPVADLTTGSCNSITTTSIDVTGEVNPLNVAGTAVWFQYGRTSALGSQSPVQKIEPPGNSLVPLDVSIGGLLPNQTYYYRLVGEDANVPTVGGEPQIAGEMLSCKTLVLRPVISGQPVVSNIGRFDADLFAEVNPEHAQTRYEFQYGACPDLELADCPGRRETTALQSNVYGVLGVTQTAAELIPGTKYRARLVAVNEYEVVAKEQVTGGEAEFTTQSPPHPTATTGSPASITTNTAALIGFVDPDGVVSTYSFQLGVNIGAGTSYSTVNVGGTGAGFGDEEKSFGVSGLQPNTTYLYRIVISNSDGTIHSDPVQFTTASFPQVFVAPEAVFLPMPKGLNFPVTVTKPTSKKMAKKKKVAKKKGKEHKNGKKARQGSQGRRRK